MTQIIDSGAEISSNTIYRYLLWRTWSRSEASLNFVMLNPSTADANTDDNTIRRCMKFAEREGFGGITVTNLYALRSRYPSDLVVSYDAEGPENLRYVSEMVDSGALVAAWGAGAVISGIVPSRAKALIEAHASQPGSTVRCLGTTKHNHPCHPLYLKTETPLEIWRP